MCGAAAETILLVTAINKSKDEQGILKIYFSKSGRQQLENLLVGQANKQFKEEFKGFNSLLKYWRDESSHGYISKISENEAYTAIAMLLRFAMFINTRWDELTNQ